ncbi:copper resistance protein CopC [Nocardia sp. NPDC060249]|uniref:copper resistance CopC/CopD family protein n=1 Tax=Nocardia sp. NPDC060249 TaxID=3347082 RepID=UPI00365589B0
MVDAVRAGGGASAVGHRRSPCAVGGTPRAPWTSAAPGRHRLRWTVVVFAALVWTLGAVGAAAAHAVLVGTDPGYGKVLVPGQDRVSVTFDEAVTVAESGLTVLDRDGVRVGIGEIRYADNDHTVSGALPAELADGTYLLSWVILSADGHTVGGSSVFGVGVPPDTTLTAPPPDPLSAALDTMVRLLTALGHVGIVLGVGVPVVVLLCGPAAPALVRQLGVTGAVTIAVTSVAVFAITPGRLGGTAGWADPSVWGSAFTSTTGASALIRAVGALVLGIGLVPMVRVIAARSARGVGDDASEDRHSPPPRLPAFRRLFGPGAPNITAAGSRIPAAVALLPATVGALIVLVASAASGHAVSGPNRVVAVASTTGHIAAVAVWAGGIVAALLVWRGSERSAALRRFGALAIAAVVVLAVTGTVQALRAVEPLAALWTTSWGRLLLAKLVAVLLALVVAALIRRHLSRGEFRPVWLRAESATLGAVLVISAVLAGITPARDAYDPPVHTTVTLGPVRALLDVDGTGAGEQQLTVRVSDANGTPLDVLDLTGRLTRDDNSLPLDIEFRRVTPRDLAPDYFLAETRIPVSGEWRLRVTVTVDRSTAYAATVPYRVW